MPLILNLKMRKIKNTSTAQIKPNKQDNLRPLFLIISA
jgi:hypothetical protein